MKKNNIWKFWICIGIIFILRILIKKFQWNIFPVIIIALILDAIVMRIKINALVERMNQMNIPNLPYKKPLSMFAKVKNFLVN